MGQLRPFDLVAGLGGVMLLVSLFLHWYGIDVPEGHPALTSTADMTAWQAFAVIDVLLAAAALLAIAVPVITAVSRGPAKPVAIAVVATTVCPLALLLVIFRLLDHVGPLEVLGLEVSFSLRLGAWLGLAGALIAAVGSFGALKDESTPGAEPPEVPRRPAPPAGAA
jgi:uncharacterized membrane protein